MNILYLTWGEVVTNYGIFNNQVLEQVKTIKQLNSDNNIWVISGLPFINRQFLFRRPQFDQEIKRIRLSFAEENIKFTVRWIPVIARWFHSQFYQLSFYTMGQTRFLRNFIADNHIDIIHCRGYHATRLALQTRDEHNLSVKVVFDTRGMFPEEGLLADFYTEKSKTYQTWKKIEQKLWDTSNAVVNVSDTFTEYVSQNTKNPNLYTVYTSTNLKIFHRNNELRQTARQELGITNHQKVLVFIGDIGTSGWDRVSSLIKLFFEFRKVFDDAVLLIVTRSNFAPLEEEMSANAVQKSNYRLVSAATPAQVNYYLNAADYSTLTYYDPKDDIGKKTGFTVVASKTGEYFALGIPLIVNQAAGAATRIVRKHKVGCTYKSGMEEDIVDCLNEIESRYELVSERCQEVAKSYFDGQMNARKYLKIYSDLLKSGVDS